MPEKTKIIVADDNLMNREMLLMQLHRLGYEADGVANGAELLEGLAAHNHYALVLMDCHMPELDGFKATRRIRELERLRKSPRLPIVALTASVTKQDQEKCFNAGMDDFIPKPFEMDELDAVLRRWIPWQGEHSRAELPPRTQPPPLSSGDRPLIDRHVLAKLGAFESAEGARLLRGLVTIFFNTVPSRLEALRQAIAASQPRALEEIAHSLKSSCSLVGARHMADLCQSLEKMGASDVVRDAELLVDSLANEYRRVHDALSRIRDELPST